MKTEILTKTENVMAHSTAEEVQILELHSHSYFPFNHEDIPGSKDAICTYYYN